MSVSSDDEDDKTTAAGVELRRQGLDNSSSQNNGASEVPTASPSEDAALQPRKWGLKDGEDDVSLDVLKERHRKRAERFDVSYSEPKAGGKLKTKIYKAQGSDAGMETGLDIYSEEQINKRKERALKFGVTEAPIIVDSSKKNSTLQDKDSNASDGGEEAAASAKLKIEERAKRFGQEVPSFAEEEDNGMAIDTLESAKPLDETADIRKDAIHVHGTDLCSTKDLINYFKAYNPKHVEWINDSSCNIVFSDENSTKRAMAGKLRDKSAFMSIDGPKLPSFLEFEAGEDCTASSTGAKVEIQYRYATSSDVKVFKDNYVSRRMWEKKGEAGHKRSGKKGSSGNQLKMGLDVDLDQIIQAHRASASRSRYSPYDSKSSRRNQRRKEKRSKQRNMRSINAGEGDKSDGGDLRMVLKGRESAEEQQGQAESMDVNMET